MAEVLTTDRKIRFTATNSKVQVNFGQKKTTTLTNYWENTNATKLFIFSFNRMLEER